MLKLSRVPAAHGDYASVHVQLSHNGHPAPQLKTEGFLRALPQPQEANQNVLIRVFVGQERLPATVCNIISPHQLNLLNKKPQDINFSKLFL